MELSRVKPRLAAAPRGKPNKQVSIAVVGCGYWGAKHGRVLSTLPEVGYLVAVDGAESVRSSIAATFPALDTSPDLQSVIHSVDAVVVATPPRDHATVALQAMRAGKHVLIEKPLAASLIESRALVAEAARSDVVLMVGHTFEYNPALRELRRRMDQGELGTIQYIHSARLNLGLYRSDVNVVWDLAPHDISIMNYLLRSTPASVRAWGSASLASDQADVAYFQLNYESQHVVGYGHVSWLDPRKVRQVIVVGSQKMAVYDDLADERLRVFDCGVDVASAGHDRLPLSYRRGDIISPRIDFEEPLLLEDRHFVECVLTDAQPISDGASGLSVIAVLDAIDSAMARGQVVDVDRAPTSAAALLTG
jgi:predicted dehydrogenase